MPDITGTNADHDRRYMPRIELMGMVDPGWQHAQEILQAWTYAYTTFYKTFTYNVGGDLTDIDVYDTAAMVTHLFHKDFTYNVGGDLIQILITRIADGDTITKDFVYNVGGDLINITVTAVP